jgi:hypothetical protein
MNSTIVRKLSDGEELIVVGHLNVSTSNRTNPRDSSIERRSLALNESPRPGSAKPNVRPRHKE